MLLRWERAQEGPVYSNFCQIQPPEDALVGTMDSFQLLVCPPLPSFHSAGVGGWRVN